jgi:hypothetical protein
MSRPDSVSTDLVDQVIAQKPLHAANDAIAAMKRLIELNVEDRYDGIRIPGHYASHAYRVLFGIPIVGGLGLMAGLVGLMPLAYACWSALPAMLAAPFLYDTYIYTDQFVFRKGCSEVSATASVLPKETQRSLQRFLDTAKRVFLLARVAVVQEDIAAGIRRSPRALRSLEHSGLLLLDRAANSLSLDDGERGRLRAAFRAGQLPKPQKYVEELRQEYEIARQALTMRPLPR